MKSLIKKSAVLFTLIGMAGVAGADSATPLNISSGYNEDVIANGSGTAASSTTGAIDGSTQNNVFYDSTYASSHSISGGALTTGTVTATDGNEFTIAPATGNNVLYLDDSTTSGTLDFSSPAKLASIVILDTAGNGPTTVDYTLHFAGGATYSNGYSIADWYETAKNGVINNLSRVDSATGVLDAAQELDFNLWDQTISIPVADQSSDLDSISFTYSSGGEASIFAASGIAPVPEPSTLTLAGLGGLSLLRYRRRK